MSEPELSFEERRQQLAIEIARQRTELAHAYSNLEKPLRYTEYGMRGFAFLRQNSWIFAAVPSTLSVASMLFGLVRKKKSLKAAPKVPTQSQASLPKGQQRLNHLKTAVNYGWQLYQLYRRIRP